FFSSRRRHTRWPRDWSSDVCSSDLTLDVLPGIAAAVAGRCPVLLDGGIRRGVDALAALALGADAVLVGRPILHGLASDGEAGVTDRKSVVEGKGGGDGRGGRGQKTV